MAEINLQTAQLALRNNVDFAQAMFKLFETITTQPKHKIKIKKDVFDKVVKTSDFEPETVFKSIRSCVDSEKAFAVVDLVHNMLEINGPSMLVMRGALTGTRIRSQGLGI